MFRAKVKLAAGVTAAVMVMGAAAGVSIRGLLAEEKAPRPPQHDAAQPPTVIRTEHPRLWITPARLAVMREKMKQNSEDWQIVKNIADRAPEKGKGFFDCYSYLVATCLCYQVYKDVDPEQAKKYAAKAYNLMAYAVEKPDPDLTGPYKEEKGSPVDGVLDNDGNAAGYAARGTMLTIPIAYDWLYDYLSPEQRKNIAHKLSVWCDWLNKFATTGKGSIDNFSVSYFVGEAYTAIVTSGEDPDAQRHMENAWKTYVNITRKAIIEGSLRGGAFTGGRGYGAHTTSVLMDLFAAWKGATDYDPLTDHSYPRDHVRYMTYSTLPSLSQIYTDGDAETNGIIEPIYDWNTVLVGSALFANEPLGQHAQWWLNHVKTTRRDPPDWHRMLWRNPGPPERPPDDLPGMYAAEGSGMVFTRSSWKSDATFVSFHCGAKPLSDHPHPDQGHFTLFKNGWLIPETASYEQGHGTDRHNTLLVGPVPYAGDKTITGQCPLYEEPAKFLGAEDTRDYSYMHGDAAGPYNWTHILTPKRLELFDRQIVFLKPDYVVVCDRVIAVKPEFGKTSVLCFGKEPQTEGDLVTGLPLEGTGKVYVHLLLPKAEAREITKNVITPKSRWLSDSTMNSHWTLHISPKDAAKKDLFLYTFQACAGAEEKAAEAKLFEAEGAVGAMIGDRAAVFPTGGEFKGGAEYALESSTAASHLVCGLKPDAKYKVSVNGQALDEFAASKSGVVSFKVGLKGTLRVVLEQN